MLYTQHNNDERHSSLEKIYLTLYLKGLCARGSWRPNRTATYWLPLYWPSPRFFPVLLGCSTGGLGAQPLWVLDLSTTSYLQLVWSPSSLNFPCTKSSNSSTPTQYPPTTGHRNMHFRRLWNGMFDHHRAEITVMQFTVHSLPVHQFLTVPWDFNPVPIF